MGLNTCASRIESATKTMDFFISDIMDYTYLHKKSMDFKKDEKVICLKATVSEITTVLDDKIKLKQITLTSEFIYKGE